MGRLTIIKPTCLERLAHELATNQVTGFISENMLLEILDEDGYKFLYRYGRIHHGVRVFPRSLVADYILNKGSKPRHIY